MKAVGVETTGCGLSRLECERPWRRRQGSAGPGVDLLSSYGAEFSAVSEEDGFVWSLVSEPRGGRRLRADTEWQRRSVVDAASSAELPFCAWGFPITGLGGRLRWDGPSELPPGHFRG